MRIKLYELLLSAALLTWGIKDILNGESFYKGYPLPLWTAYSALIAGIAIPVLAWFLRKPPKNDDH